MVQNQKYIQTLLDNLLQQCDRWIVTGSSTCQERAHNILKQIQHQSLNSLHDVEKARTMITSAGMPLPSQADTNKQLGKTNPAERRLQAQERNEWEQEWSSLQGRSALSRRNNQNDLLMDTNLKSFVHDKNQLQTQMNDNQSVDNTDDNDVSQQSLQDAAVKSAELVALAGNRGTFEGEQMGIGGLDEVLGEIKRRIWVPLAAPPTLLNELGISPVRGLLLYGRPGCGKTLLARTVGQILSPARPITVVSGPELMDKYVGSSEKVGTYCKSGC